MIKRTGKKTVFYHFAAIVLAGVLAYSNTLHVPFQWDERMIIENNPIVKDIGYFLHPSKAQGLSILYYSFKNRYVGYLTFALNYRLHGLDVTGYHVVNIALHILNSLLVYMLVRLTLRTPFLSGSLLGRHSGAMAFFTGLLFVAHPVQTEAVTYIVRFPALMAFFYLSSMVLYAKWRLTPLTLNPSPTGRGQGVRVILYSLSLLCAVLAMKTKENALTLPLMITLYEFSFFTPTVLPLNKGGIKGGYRLLYLVPFLLTLFIIPLTLVGIDRPMGEILGGMDSATRHFSATPRGDYLITQFRVVATYIRLLFLPVNQNFDYDFRISRSIFEPQVLLSLLLIASALCVGVFLFYRSRKRPDLRLPAFGILWFFLALSVESSIFPIPMIMCEYRVYLPSAGFFVMAVAAAFYLSEISRPGIGRVLNPLFSVIIIVLAATAYARNTVWKDTVTLWQDVVRKSPRSAGAYTGLGVAYEVKGLKEEAAKYYGKALELEPFYPEAHLNLGNLYRDMGETDRAIEHYRMVLAMVEDYKLHFDIGKLYMKKGDFDRAIVHFERTLALGNFPGVHRHIGKAYEFKGLLDKAAEHYRLAKRGGINADAP